MEDFNLILDEFDDFCLKNEVKVYEKAFKNIADSKEVQIKCKMIIKDKNKMRELEIIFLIIHQNIEQEIRVQRKGIAFHLLRIIRNCLEDSAFWEKLMLIIVCHKHKSIKLLLDHIIEINCIYEVIY